MYLALLLLLTLVPLPAFADGLSAPTITRVCSSYPSASDCNDLGAAVAVGDFDGDGYKDVAVGSPSDWSVGVPNAGLVHVSYGAASGLSGVGAYSGACQRL